MQRRPVDTRQLAAVLEADLLKLYGAAMIGGKALRAALGFQTPIAFRVAISKGKVGVPIFRVPGRKGYWALVKDISTWMVDAHQYARRPGEITQNMATKRQSKGR